MLDVFGLHMRAWALSVNSIMRLDAGPISIKSKETPLQAELLQVQTKSSVAGSNSQQISISTRP